MKKLSLVNLSKKQLSKKQMQKVRGGEVVAACICSCDGWDQYNANFIIATKTRHGSEGLQ